MAYEYKVVPFIGQSRGGLSATEVARQLEQEINAHAAQGWEFWKLADVNIEVQPGCIAGLFGARVQYVRLDQLIFRADVTAEVQSMALPPKERNTERASRRAPQPAVTENVMPVRHADQRSREPLPAAQKHLEVWRHKSDHDIMTAAASLDDYTEEARAVIRAELIWRNLESSKEHESGLNVDSFCYHCGSDVPVGSSRCEACGNSLEK